MTAFTGPLIDPQRLHVLLAGAQPPLVADCRFALADPAAGEAAYREAHIPCAVYLHLERDLSGPSGPTGGRHPLPSPEAFGRTLRRVGLDAGRLLVACDDSRGAFAARLWWLARYFGHERVCVLDGGVSAWTRAGLPLDGAIPAPPAGDFEPRPRAAMRIDYEELAPRVAAGTLALVDAREPRRFAGLEETHRSGGRPRARRAEPPLGRCHARGGRLLPRSGGAGAALARPGCAGAGGVLRLRHHGLREPVVAGARRHRRRAALSRQLERLVRAARGPGRARSVGLACVGRACVGRACVGRACVGRACVGRACVGRACVGRASARQGFGAAEPADYPRHTPCRHECRPASARHLWVAIHGDSGMRQGTCRHECRPASARHLWVAIHGDSGMR